MRRNTPIVALLIGLVVAFTGIAVGQQFAYRVQANIPVDFYVGDQHQSAGSYLFTVNCSDNAVTITNLANRHSTVVAASSPIEYASDGYGRRASDTVVELNSIDGKYVLADIQTRTNGVTLASESAKQNFAGNHGVVRVVATLR